MAKGKRGKGRGNYYTRRMADPQLVQHRITSQVPNVRKFAGKRNKSHNPDIETWIKEVENYFTIKKDLTEQEKLAEAKQFLEMDPEKGDLETQTKCVTYEERITKWSELKQFLRKRYAAVGEDHPVQTLAVILDKYYRTPKDLDVVAPKTYGWIRELETKLKSSDDWTYEDDNGERVMKLADFAAMQRLSMMINVYPTAVVRRMKRKWKREDDKQEIEEAAAMVKDSGRETEITATTSNADNSTGARSKGPTESYKRGRLEQRGTVYQRGPTPIPKCYNCQKTGHMAKDCRGRPYCIIHKKEGHSTRDCYSNRYRSQSRRRGGRDRSYSPAFRYNQRGRGRGQR